MNIHNDDEPYDGGTKSGLTLVGIMIGFLIVAMILTEFVLTARP